MPEEKEVNPEEDENIWVNNPAFLLPRFNTLHSLTKEQLKQGDVDKARQNYHRMLELYNEISKSSLSNDEKKGSYQKLGDVFNTLSNPSYEESSGFVPLAKYLFPISFIVIILLIIFFVKPELALTGLLALGSNSAPEWTDGGAEFAVHGITQINLDNYFADPDGDKLTYLVTDAPNLDVSVSGSMLTIVPEQNLRGIRTITIFASDLNKITKVSARLNIK